MGDILKNWNNQKLIFRLLMHGLRNQIFTLRLRVLYLQYKIVLLIQEIIKNIYAVYNRSSINVEFAELKGKPLNTSFLLAPFWLKANIRNVMIYALKLYTSI
jgi:hypothetical protein